MGDNWICFGDFNDILQEGEKARGNNKTSSHLSWGRQVIDQCGLQDLGFEGYPFTWSNGRSEEANIKCRLDRALATTYFIQRFSPINILHLPRYGSDHSAIRIDMKVM